MAGPETLSVVAPTYNNAGTIDELHQRLRRVTDDLGMQLELVFVDDGSKDGSFEKVVALAERDRSVRAIELSRNFGQQAAVTAGLDVVRGEWIVVMDADLQDRPEHIAPMLAKAREGYDMVYAVGRCEDDPFLRRLASRLFNSTYRLLADTYVPPRTGLFRVMHRRVVEAFRRLPERRRFVLGLLSWTGFRSIGIELPRDPRGEGRSQFKLFRLIRLALDAVLSFSSVPLRLALWLGLCCSAMGFLFGLWTTIRKLTIGIDVPGEALIVCSILLFGGIQLMMLGLIGEYVGRIYVEVKGRPLYLVRSRIGFTSAADPEESRDGSVLVDR